MAVSLPGLSQGINPRGFILEEKVGFLHRFKPYALVARDIQKLSQREMLAWSRTFACKVNNYRLVLHDMAGKMPDEKSENLLSSLLSSMDKAWEGRSTLYYEMRNMADEIANVYEKLATYLEESS